MEIKLLPCPFCDGEAEINPAVIPGSIYVACKYCRTASAVYDDEDRAAKAWNTRTNRDLFRAAEMIESRIQLIQEGKSGAAMMKGALQGVKQAILKEANGEN